MTTDGQRSEPPNLILKPVPSSQCLAGFSCGVEEIDQWAKNKAFKLHSTGRARVNVAFAAGSERACGFYSLSLSMEERSKLLGQEDRDAWRLGAPFVYMDWLAVVRSRQGSGIGTYLLLHALKQAAAAHSIVPFYGIGLRSLTDRTTRLYQRFGFRQAPNETGAHPLLILPIQSALELFG